MQLSVIWRDREQLTGSRLVTAIGTPDGARWQPRPMHTALLIDNQHRIRRRIKSDLKHSHGLPQLSDQLMLIR